MFASITVQYPTAGKVIIIIIIIIIIMLIIIMLGCRVVVVISCGAGQEQASQSFIRRETQTTSRIRVVATYFIDTQLQER